MYSSVNHMTVALLELSGGQKSLVSIALVLSQVVYHPFPLYIFDEVGIESGK